MAIIGSTYDETKALEDQTYAYNAWLNRNYEGNSLRITKEQNDLIETTWSAYMCNWEVPDVSQAFVAMGVAGAGMSTHGIVQQSKFLGDINDTIDTRSGLQGTSEASLGLYDLNIDKHQTSAKIVAQTAENGLENVDLFTSAVSTAQSLTLTVGGGDNGSSTGLTQGNSNQTDPSAVGGFGSLTGTKDPENKNPFM